MATEDQIANLLVRLVGIPEQIAAVVAGWDANARAISRLSSPWSPFIWPSTPASAASSN